MSTTLGKRSECAPYIGPGWFDVDDGWRFHGRDREIGELEDIVIASRIVLLYSPSGAGKTSLLNAALIPRLKKEGFDALPVIHVHHPPDGSGGNRFITSALLSLEEKVPEEHRTPRERLRDMDLARYLDSRPKSADSPEDELLVFDQFERILTEDPGDLEAKAEFFEQVGMALRNRRRWAIFAMREDYVAGLDPYRDAIPTDLETTFRLELLTPHAAMEAIQEPARECGVRFSDEAAEQLVNELNKGHRWVEPVQLQVVCRRIWDQLPEGTTEIRASDADVTSTSVDAALEAYYETNLAAVIATSEASEYEIREWFDTELISPHGIRTLVLLENGAAAGMRADAVRMLIDAYLLRTYSREHATWVELAHDRLVAPVRESNRAWKAANLSTLQREAIVWDEQGRSPDLLLRGVLLVEAEQWARQKRDLVTKREREFLNASRAARDAARNRVWRWGALAATLLTFVLVGLAWWAWTERGTAEAQRDIAQSQRTNAEVAANAAATSEAEAIAAQATAEWQANVAATSEAVAVDAQAAAEQQANVNRAQAMAAQSSDQYELGEDERGALLAVEAYRLDQENGGASLTQADNSLRTVLGRGGIGSSLIHNNPVNEVAFSPDGTILATGTYGEVRLWDAATGEPRGEPLLQGSTWVYAVAFSPDGETLAIGTGASLGTGTFSGEARLWDVTTRQPRGAPLPHDDWVAAVAFSPDGEVLATGSDDGTARLWDVATGQPLSEPLAHDGRVYSVAFNPDGSVLATSGADGVVRFWEVAMGQPRGESLSHDGSVVYAVAFSPDGSTLATGTYGEVRLWDVATRQPKATPLVHDDWVRAVAFSPDGTMLATGSEDRTVRLWDVATSQPLGAPLVHEGWVNTIAFSPDGEVLATGSEDRTVRVWDLVRWKGDPSILGHGSYTVFATAFSPDGEVLATGSDDGTARLWDVATGQPREEALHHDNWVYSVAFSPDGTTLATGTYGEVRVWDLTRSDAPPLVLPHDGWPVSTLAFSPDGATLATGIYGEVRFWDVATGEPQGEPLSQGDKWVNAVAYSPDGATLAIGTGAALATGNGDGAARLWDVATRQPKAVSMIHQNAVYTVAFSPDGAMLATGSNGEVRLWDVATGGSQGDPLPHDDWVNSVDFSPDGTTLATGTFRAALLWDLTRSGVEPLVLRHENRVDTVAFSPDGGALATGTFRAALLWTVDTGELAEQVCRGMQRNLTLAEWERFVGSDIPYRQTCPDLPPGEGAPGSDESLASVPVASPVATPADVPTLGLIGEGEYVSPQYWVEVTWTDAWEIGDPDNSHVEHAIPDGFDGPILSVPGTDAIFLMDSASESGVVSISANPSYGDSPAMVAQAMRSPAYLEDTLYVSSESDVLLLDQTETAAAVLVRDADNPGHLVYVEVVFPPGETYSVFVGLDLWEPDAYAEVLAAVERDLDIAGVELFSVADVDTLLEQIDAATAGDDASTPIVLGEVRATPIATPMDS